MAIYIKGMEIPKSCDECRMAEGGADWFCHAADKWFDDEWFVWPQYEDGYLDTSKPLNCPLVYIPEPHGRLIDADKLADDLEYDALHYDEDHEMKLNCASWLRSNATPTVIEGSE